MPAIDIDRGVMIRENAKLGMNVYMYIDQPGEYLTAHGQAVPEGIAKDAGFDVVNFGKAKEKRERMSKAMRLIEEEVEGQSPEDIVSEKGDFRTVNFGLGRFKVKDKDGNELHATFLGKEAALKLMDQFAAPQKDAAKVEVKK